MVILIFFPSSHKCQEAHWKSGHKTKCKDLRPPGVNSTAGSGRKTSGLGGKSCSGIALVPAHGRGISKPIKQPKKVIVCPPPNTFPFAL